MHVCPIKCDLILSIIFICNDKHFECNRMQLKSLPHRNILLRIKASQNGSADVDLLSNNGMDKHQQIPKE